MEIKGILAATVVAVFMGGVAFAQTSVLREADKRQREAEQYQRQAEQRQRQERNASAPKVLQRAAENFVVVGPGVVHDKTTRLEWMRCSLGQDWSEKTKTCEGDAEVYIFERAQELARRLNAAGGYNGKTDWRLPTKDELATLIVCSHGVVGNSCATGSWRPTIEQTVFPKTPPSFYWTSSGVGFSGSAWYVYFGYGYVGSYSRDYGYHVRLVRASQ